MANLTIPSHSRFPWYTSGDENNLSTFQALCQAVLIILVAGNNALSVDVTDISGNACKR